MESAGWLKNPSKSTLEVPSMCHILIIPYSKSTLDVLYSLIVSLFKNKISHKKVFVVLFEDTNATLSVSLHILSLFVYISLSWKRKYTLFRVYASSPHS